MNRQWSILGPRLHTHLLLFNSLKQTTLILCERKMLIGAYINIYVWAGFLYTASQFERTSLKLIK